ncbi:hypothetical protein HanPSC8_Chr03g0087841 [Helianthus annuus]|nr:hypothetical protein HanPSC8_Chr03g0087841 [Helianthus annuus]
MSGMFSFCSHVCGMASLYGVVILAHLLLNGSIRVVLSNWSPKAYSLLHTKLYILCSKI